MIYLTGDLHREIYPRLSFDNFPEQRTLTRNDYLIVLGDFGTPWANDPTDRYILKELENRPFTTLFLDGNHENFDRLNNYPVVPWCYGTVHYISPHVLHLMRGQIYTIDSLRIFTFGGAASHDIEDGILNPYDPEFRHKKQQLRRANKKHYRIEHVDWWKEELPSPAEYNLGWSNLVRAGFSVDTILTHCPPEAAMKQAGHFETNELTDFLNAVQKNVTYQSWYAGHVHKELHHQNIHTLYESIIPLTKKEDVP